MAHLIGLAVQFLRLAGARQRDRLDPLTGALTRQAFIRRFEQEAERVVERRASRFAILLVNVDQFRQINDCWGERAGDRLLMRIVETMRPALRKSDLIGRLEGDVFAILLRASSGEAAAAAAQGVRRAIESQASARAALKNPVAVSVGVAVYGKHGRRWEEVLPAAHAAARAAKADGGNRVIGAASVLRPVADMPALRAVGKAAQLLASKAA